MSVLGATTEQLVDLAGQLDATTADIAAVHVETQGIATAVCDEMEACFVKAITAIGASMGELRTTVAVAQGRLAETTWTGVNRSTFDSAYLDFDGAMASLDGAVRDAYDQFDAQMKQISALIGEFQAQVGISMDQAQMSTRSMSVAVTSQRENLETVMNTGLAVG